LGGGNFLYIIFFFSLPLALPNPIYQILTYETISPHVHYFYDQFHQISRKLSCSNITYGCSDSHDGHPGWSSALTIFDVEIGPAGFTPTGTPTDVGVSIRILKQGLTRKQVTHIMSGLFAGLYTAYGWAP